MLFYDTPESLIKNNQELLVKFEVIISWSNKSVLKTRNTSLCSTYHGWRVQQPTYNYPTPIVQPTLIDPIVTHSSLGLEEEVSKNLAACHSTVHQIRNSCEFPARIHSILKENQKLMYNYLVLFRSKFGLKKLLLSVLNTISRNEIVSLKLCKKVPQRWLIGWKNWSLRYK